MKIEKKINFGNSNLDFSIYKIKFSPDKSIMAISRGCFSTYIEIWDYKNKLLIKILNFEETIDSFYLVNNQTLVFLCDSEEIKIINIYNEKEIKTLKKIETDEITYYDRLDLYFNNSFDKFATIFTKKTFDSNLKYIIEIWDLNNNKIIKSFSYEKNLYLNKAIFNLNDKYLLLGYSDKENSSLYVAGFTPDDKYLLLILFTSKNTEILFFDYIKEEFVKKIELKNEKIKPEEVDNYNSFFYYGEDTYEKPSIALINKIEFDIKNDLIGFATNESIRVFNYSTLNSVSILRIVDLQTCPTCNQGLSVGIETFKFLENDLIVCLSEFGLLYLLDIKTGKTIFRDKVKGNFFDFEITEDKNIILAGGKNEDYSINLYEIIK